MKKLGIAFLFFTLCVIISSASFGQSSLKTPWDGTISINGDVHLNHGTVSINGDSIVVEGSAIPDSTFKKLKRLHRAEQNSSNHYLSKDGENYYMEIVPPALKGKKVDDSNIWLLGDEVAQSCR
jgi:hypothetical protein